MAKEIKELPDNIKRLAEKAWLYSLIDEADKNTAERIKGYELSNRVAIGAEMFKAELLNLLSEYKLDK